MLETLEKYRPFLLIAAGLLAAGVVMFAPGCDGFQRSAGVPTREQFQALEDAEIKARNDAAIARANEAAALAQVGELSARQDAVQARRTQLAEQYAQLADQLAGATRDNVAALIGAYRAAMRSVEIELAAIDNTRAKLDAAIADANATINASGQARDAAEKDIARVGKEIDELARLSTERVQSIADGIADIGTQLSAYGVPGAGAVGTAIANNLAPAGVGGAALLAIAAEFKRRRDRRSIAEVIAANNVAGVITPDEAAKETAKRLLSTRARKVYNAAKTDAEVIEEKMQRGVSVPAPGS